MLLWKCSSSRTRDPLSGCREFLEPLKVEVLQQHGQKSVLSQTCEKL